tara:strand:+ start:20528 stop:20998 length:471 start_codon:yes stop_codon:yes gene_type:complete
MKELETFANFPDDSRIWLYQTDRKLTEEEMLKVSERLSVFTKEWAAHGNKLWASADVINPYFVVVAVDESNTPPSGCSIDASVKELQALGKELNVDFFTRLKVTYAKNGQLDQIDFADLSSLDKDTLICDPLIAKLGDLRSKFPVKLENSSFAHVV